MKICLLPTDTELVLGDGLDRAINALPFGDAEQDRLKGIKNPSVARQSLCARIALERLCDCIDYGSIEKDVNGKPYFLNSDAPQFSLSHAQDIAAAALADACEGRIGIDIEAIRTDRNICSIAKRFFSKKELSRFNGCGGTPEEFYSIWTEKEARAKLFGDGLAFELSGQKHDAEVYYYKYDIRYGQTRAILCVASEHRANVINFIESKEFDIYELQDRA